MIAVAVLIEVLVATLMWTLRRGLLVVVGAKPKASVALKSFMLAAVG